MRKILITFLLGFFIVSLSGCGGVDEAKSKVGGYVDEAKSKVDDWFNDDEGSDCSIDLELPSGEIRNLDDPLCTRDDPDFDEDIESTLEQYENEHRFEKDFQGLFAESQDDPIVEPNYEVNTETLETLKENEESIVLEPEYSTKTYTFEIQLEGGTLDGDGYFQFELEYGESFDEEILSKATTDISKPLLYFDGYFSKSSGLGEQYADENEWFVETLTYDNFTDAFDAMESSDDEKIIIYAYYVSEETQ